MILMLPMMLMMKTSTATTAMAVTVMTKAVITAPVMRVATILRFSDKI